MSENSPEEAQKRRNVTLELGAADWANWISNPVTRSYLQYLDDQYAAFRETAVDLLESGAYAPGARPEMQNPDVVRGQLTYLKVLRRLNLRVLQSFYGKEPPAEEQRQE